MANLIHRTSRDALGKLLRLYSVNTPAYSTDDWLVNPNLDAVSGVEERYWKVTGTPPDGEVVEMSAGEKASLDSTVLSTLKAAKKTQLIRSRQIFLDGRYNPEDQSSLDSMYTTGVNNKPNRKKYVDPYVDWIRQVDSELTTKLDAVEAATDLSDLNAIQLDTTTLIAADPQVTVKAALAVSDSTDLDSFLNSEAVVTDSLTNVSGPFHLMQILMNRRELFNDTENPVYHASVTPILGNSGHLVSQANRINNLELIHGKYGWHSIQVIQATYHRPKDLLIYYGYPNSFNSGVNGWYNEKVAQDMAKYGLIVLGNGVQEPTHPDYANTQIIIPRIQTFNPKSLIFGYVSANQDINSFKAAVDKWDTLQVHGIMMDEAGYDFGETRLEFNERVNYVHGKSYAKICFANAWNTDHVIGTANDPSFPNSTFNPSATASALTSTDWILLESFPINTAAYTGTGGYESASDWITRGDKLAGLKAAYGVNFAGVGIINNDNASGQNLFSFGFISAFMYCLDGFGTSDTSYGSGATVTYWNRPDVSNMGVVWDLYPVVVQDTVDTDVYRKYVEFGRVSLDFSSGAQTFTITKT